MEFLHGTSLQDELQRDGVRVAEAVRVGREVAAGLAAAHALGVVHRDVKPDNIWLEGPDRRVKLIDFGLARMADEGADTKRGLLIGTPAYMAPEQARGDVADARTDLFGLGGVLYRMVTGKLPFPGTSAIETLNRLTSDEPPTPIPELRPDAPPRLVALIERLLAKDPADRPQSAAEVARELAAIETDLLMADTGLVVVALSAPGPDVWTELDGSSGPGVRRRSSRREYLWMAGAVLVAVVAAALVAPRLRPPSEAHSGRPAPRPARLGLPAGFEPLFNGKDLTGWFVPGGATGGWYAADGVLAGDANHDGPCLLTAHEYDDFDLRLEYRWPQRGGRAAVRFRAADEGPADPCGLRVTLADDDHPAAGSGGAYRTGAIEGIADSPAPGNHPVGEWNSLRVVVRRQWVHVEHKGRLASEADLDRFVSLASDLPALTRLRGRIALECV